MDLLHGGYLGPGGFMPPGGSGGIIATWPTAVGGVPWARYFIVDGDAGLDTNLGYIDAPLGTVFTPAQTTAVAIKTTGRLEAIVPAVGAGRNYIILIKPRAGRAIYDAYVAGDEQGGFRRDLRTGYALEIMRGSDLTNSLADRAQLGMVSVVGPLIVQAVGGNAYGPFVQATTPIGITPENMGKYRIRAVMGAGTFYAPCRWGDPALVPNPTIIQARSNSWGPLAPGDTIYLEEPGVRLRNFYESVCNATEPAAAPGSTVRRVALAGIEVGADTTGFPPQVRLGANLASAGSPSYYCVRSSSISTIVGGFSAQPSFIDEVGNTMFGGFGVDLWGCTSTTRADRIEIDASYLQNSITLTASYINITGSFVLLLNLTGGADGMVVNAVDYQQMFLSPRGLCVVSGSWVPLDVNQNGVILIPDQGSRAAFTIGFLVTFYGPEPAAPGVIMYPGQYSVVFDYFNIGAGATTGTGVLVKYDDVAAQTLVTYASLAITGFEIEGGQRVAVLTSSNSYPAHTLPCPRGVVLRMVDGVAGTTYPVGLVVATSSASRFVLASTQVALGRGSLAGVLLTNVTQGDGATPNGWAVVGQSGVMSVRLSAVGTAPAPGGLVYIDATNDGHASARPPFFAIPLGRAIPMGTGLAGGAPLYPIMWTPVEIEDIRQRIATVGRELAGLVGPAAVWFHDFDVASSTGTTSPVGFSVLIGTGSVGLSTSQQTALLLSSGGNAVSSATFYPMGSANWLTSNPRNSAFYMAARFSIDTAVDANSTIRAGLYDAGAAAIITFGVNGTVSAVNYSLISGANTLDSGVPIDNASHIFEIYRSTGDIAFFIDGVLVGTIPVPAAWVGAVNTFMGTNNNASAANRQLACDWIGGVAAANQ